MIIKLFGKEFKIGAYPKIITAPCDLCGEKYDLEVENDVHESLSYFNFRCSRCQVARAKLQEITTEINRKCWIEQREEIFQTMKREAEKHDTELIKGGNKHGKYSNRRNCKVNQKR